MRHVYFWALPIGEKFVHKGEVYQKIEDEYNALMVRINELLALLKDPKAILSTITKELKELKEVYGDPRKTKVIKGIIYVIDFCIATCVSSRLPLDFLAIFCSALTTGIINLDENS